MGHVPWAGPFGGCVSPSTSPSSFSSRGAQRGRSRARRKDFPFASDYKLKTCSRCTAIICEKVKEWKLKKGEGGAYTPHSLFSCYVIFSMFILRLTFSSSLSLQQPINLVNYSNQFYFLSFPPMCGPPTLCHHRQIRIIQRRLFFSNACLFLQWCF